MGCIKRYRPVVRRAAQAPHLHRRGARDEPEAAGAAPRRPWSAAEIQSRGAGVAAARVDANQASSKANSMAAGVAAVGEAGDSRIGSEPGSRGRNGVAVFAVDTTVLITVRMDSVSRPL